MIKEKEFKKDAALFLANKGLTNKNRGWALMCVENEIPIPKSWYKDFINEITDENDSYRKTIEGSLKYFGVRWVST